jgi:ornithine cyclodeaminase/alanine dehydrogenase
MEGAFASYSDGSSHVPQRNILALKNLHLFLKPAYNEELGRLAVKIISQKTAPDKKGLPTILGVVLLLDIHSGAILCMMDGACITALRTGAASGLATKLLATEHAETVALFGCGTQGKTQLEAVCQVRPIKRAFLFDVNTKAANRLQKEMQEKLKISMEVVDDLKYLQEADIICTATNTTHPLFDRKHISRGTHINAIGSYKPHMQEIDPEIIKSGKLFVDSRDSVLKESGDLIKPINEKIFTDSMIDSEIGELINKKEGGRKDKSEISIFKSVGLGVQDLFMAHMIYEKYLLQYT